MESVLIALFGRCVVIDSGLFDNHSRWSLWLDHIRAVITGTKCTFR